MKTFDQLFGKNEAKGRQLPNSMVCQEFGEVNVRTVGNEMQVIFTIMWKPSFEGCRTGIALDGSASMRDSYGLTFEWNVSPQEITKIQEDLKNEGNSRSTK